MKFFEFQGRNVALFLLHTYWLLFINILFANSLPLESSIDPFGCLSLNISFENIAWQEEIEVFAHPNRPKEKETFTLTFLKSHKSIQAHLSDRIFLSMSDGKLDYSSQKSDCILELNTHKDSKLYCTLHIALAEKFQPYVKSANVMEMILPVTEKKPDSLDTLSQDHPIVKLSKAKLLLPDQLLFSMNKEFAKAHRLLLEKDSSGFTILSFTGGDYLIYRDNEWQKAGSEENFEKKFLVLIKNISSQEAEFECWDASCMHKYVFSTKIFMPPPGNENFSQLFPSVRLKTKYQVAMQTPKQLLFLRIGDGIIFHPNFYEVIKNFQCSEHYINQIANKPFLIFDGIEEKKRQKFFIARFFDSTRSLVTQVCLPILFSGSYPERDTSESMVKKTQMAR